MPILRKTKLCIFNNVRDDSLNSTMFLIVECPSKLITTKSPWLIQIHIQRHMAWYEWPYIVSQKKCIEHNNRKRITFRYNNNDQSPYSPDLTPSQIIICFVHCKTTWALGFWLRWGHQRASHLVFNGNARGIKSYNFKKNDKRLSIKMTNFTLIDLCYVINKLKLNNNKIPF